MRCYCVTVELLAPLSLRRSRQSQHGGSLQSVSGGAFRGAVAQLYLQRYGMVDQTFRKLFVDEGTCRWGPLDPADKLFPLTALSCKRAPGFRQDGGHGVGDKLWLRIAQNQLLPEECVEVDEAWEHCGFHDDSGRPCHSPLRDQSGFWSADKIDTLVSAHVGIDRVTATAAPAVFYTLEALDPAAVPRLQGTLEADDENAALLAKLLEQEDGIVHLGHARTRGYGEARLRLEPVPAPEETKLRQNWAGWSELLQSFLGASPFNLLSLDSERDFFFSLGFPNGVLLLDRLLRYTLDPAAMIPWLPPMPREPFHLGGQPDWSPLHTGGAIAFAAAVSRHGRLIGWNIAHGLPKQEEQLVERGAVYAYWFRGGSSQREALIERLLELTRQPIGVRCSEGFGRVEVSSDFHCSFCRQEGKSA